MFLNFCTWSGKIITCQLNKLIANKTIIHFERSRTIQQVTFSRWHVLLEGMSNQRLIKLFSCYLKCISSESTIKNVPLVLYDGWIIHIFVKVRFKVDMNIQWKEIVTNMIYLNQWFPNHVPRENFDVELKYNLYGNLFKCAAPQKMYGNSD